MLIDNRRDICTSACTQDVEPRKPTCHCADGPVIMCDCFYPPIIDLDDYMHATNSSIESADTHAFEGSAEETEAHSGSKNLHAQSELAS